MLFHPKDKTRSLTPEALARALEAVPHVAPGVEAKVDSSGHLQLRKEPPTAPKRPRLIPRFWTWRRDSRTLLDAHGTFFWRQIDGQRPLRAIAAKLAQQGSLSREQAHAATVQFTQSLMLRGLIYLNVDKRGGAT